ncbi:MAG: hypothetical protein P8M25_07380, partial [Paracoccaceae bacterium]|nr:hypothetical protein [Paracoccaceae bacterium]
GGGLSNHALGVVQALYPKGVVPRQPTDLVQDVLVGGVLPLTLIVHGRDRPEALARLSGALSELIVDGVETTIPLFDALLQEGEVHRGAYTIHWLEKWLETHFST